MKLRNLTRDYRLFVNAVVFGAIATAISIMIFSYCNFQSSSKLEIEITAQKVNQQISESLTYVENITNFIGRQILTKGDEKKESVAEILRNSQLEIDQKSQDIFTWTLFDFLDSTDRVIASSAQGILAEPMLITKEKRSWIVDAKIMPWKLLPSKVDVGIISQEKIIPFGFGISKRSGKFVGTISLGINVEKLQEKLESISSAPYATFVVLDKDGFVVVASNNFERENADFFEKNFKKINPKVGFFESEVGDFFYQKNGDFQFKIITGVNQKMVWGQVWKNFVPQALNTFYLTIFFLILLYFFREKLLAPVVSLARTANDISQGKLNVSVPTSDIDEVNLLADSITKVKDFLVKEEALKQSLRSGKEIAETENYNKSEFLASTAHELKNMLAGVVGLGELIKSNLTEINRNADIVELQDKENENLAWIFDIVRLGEESLVFVNDILDINQAQTGEFKIEEVESVDLQDITLRSIKLMKTKAIHERKNIVTNFEKVSNKKFIAANLDPRRVKQAVVNIISNSIKYSPENTEIKVNLDFLTFDELNKVNDAIESGIKNNDEINALRKDFLLSQLQLKKDKQESRICIEIEDRGFGMDEEELKIAAKKYGTIKRDLTKKIDSTGLGLPIVKYLVEAQGGLLEIKSEKGKGTKVRIVF